MRYVAPGWHPGLAAMAGTAVAILILLAVERRRS
jgi:hypothetical protein